MINQLVNSNIKITLERKTSYNTRYYKPCLDGWFRDDMGMGLMNREIKISGQPIINVNSDLMQFPIKIKYLSINKDYDDKQYDKTLGYLYAFNTKEAQQVVDYLNNNKELFMP